jgi:ubiquinone/menaquinone biosynthesis C-methylase UbiE
MRLRRLARVTLETLAATLFPKWYSIRICSEKHYWSRYFDKVEDEIDITWRKTIWPQIKDADFASTLELAPGAGRNTAKLAELASTLHAVDLNEYALERLRERFMDYAGPCKVIIQKNDGASLPGVPDASITFVYSWDSGVHFDRTVHRAYLREFARVMRPGASGFMHHSDLGDDASVDIRENIHCRSNMSAELFREYAAAARLEVVRQTMLPWYPPQRGRLIEDCLSVFRKPA